MAFLLSSPLPLGRARLRLASTAAVVGLGLGALLVETPCFADDLEQAKQWVAEGDKAEGAHDYATAIDRYERAIGVKQTAALYLRLGFVQEEAGLLGDALVSYEKAKPLAAGSDKAELVDQQISKLSPKVPRVRIAITTSPAPADARVSLNGQPVGNVGSELAVNPGALEVRATATGFHDFSKHLTLAEGQHESISIGFVPIESGEPPPPPPPKRASIPGIVIGSVGVVAIGVGIGLVVEGFSVQNQLDGACTVDANGEYQCPTRIDGEIAADLPAKSNAFKGAGFTLLGVGGAGAIVGGVLLGLSLESPARAPAAVSVMPIVSPGFGGAVVGGRF